MQQDSGGKGMIRLCNVNHIIWFILAVKPEIEKRANMLDHFYQFFTNL